MQQCARAWGRGSSRQQQVSCVWHPSTRASPQRPWSEPAAGTVGPTLGLAASPVAGLNRDPAGSTQPSEQLSGPKQQERCVW